MREMTLNINDTQIVVTLHPITVKSDVSGYCTEDGSNLDVKKDDIIKTTRTYVTKDGQEVKSADVCRFVESADGQKPTKRYEPSKNADLQEVGEDINELFKSYAEHMLLFVVETTDNAFKKALLEDKKSYKFNFVKGRGYKSYLAYITAYSGKIVIYGCRGSVKDLIGSYDYGAGKIHVMQGEQMMKGTIQIMVR